MTSYVEATLVIEGALQETATFSDGDALVAWLSDVERDAREHGAETDVYLLEHAHAPGLGECACVQYLTDHHPFETWNQEGES